MSSLYISSMSCNHYHQYYWEKERMKIMSLRPVLPAFPAVLAYFLFHFFPLFCTDIIWCCSAFGIFSFSASCCWEEQSRGILVLGVTLIRLLHCTNVCISIKYFTEVTWEFELLLILHTFEIHFSFCLGLAKLEDPLQRQSMCVVVTSWCLYVKILVLFWFSVTKLWKTP